MRKELQERRDRAGKRHEPARERDPKGKLPSTIAEYRALIDELEAIVAEADEDSSDPVELGRTYRWLADIYGDAGEFGAGMEHYAELATEKYTEAERLFADNVTPVEQAKLDFNFAEHLWRLAGGADVHLLEAAIMRFGHAAEAFKDTNLDRFARAAEDRIKKLNEDMPLFRHVANVKEATTQIKELEAQLKHAGPAERRWIEDEVSKMEATMLRGASSDVVANAFDALKARAPDEADDGTGKALLEDLKQQYGLMEEARRASSGRSIEEEDPSYGADALLEQAREVIRQASATGEAKPHEADTLMSALDRLQQHRIGYIGEKKTSSEAARADEVLESLINDVQGVSAGRRLSLLDVPKGSLAALVISILEPLDSWITAENSKRGRSREEKRRSVDLHRTLAQLKKRTRLSVANEEALSEILEPAWRLASDIQLYARRHHLMLAQPNFSTIDIKVTSKSLFLSGGSDLRAAADVLSARDRLTLFSFAGSTADMAERWSQLRAATVAIFDVGASGSSRAQVYYELGLALALGKPIVVVTHPGIEATFNVPFQPVYFCSNVEANAALLDQGIARALSTILWSDAEHWSDDLANQTLTWLGDRCGDRLTTSAGELLQDVRLRGQNAMIFRQSLMQLLDKIGPDRPVILHPAWLPVYPDISQPKRCFHVTPFGNDEDESRAKFNKRREEAAQYFESKDWIYTRGDEGDEQRILKRIWREISMASVVLVDISDHNPNVALELGLAHALGRSCLIVQEGEKAEPFPAIAKIDVHTYEKGLDEVWRKFENFLVGNELSSEVGELDQR